MISEHIKVRKGRSMVSESCQVGVADLCPAAVYFNLLS